MHSIINRIQRSLAIHGFMGTFRLCVAKILWFTPSHRRARAVVLDLDLKFDQRWGVDTSGNVLPSRSEVIGSNWVYGGRYQGINPTDLDQALSELPIHHEHFTFVDFGSGKGRAILVASRFPFRKIIGVEYSKQLNDIARHNVSRFPKNEKRCKDVELIHADAATYPIPKGPLVIFLYNSFGKAVMTQLVQNVSTSFQEDPRRIIVLYFRAECADVWRNAGFMEEVRASKWISIYDTQVRKASAST